MSLDTRERFSSRLGLVATMIGVAVGLGNVWRFPYMVGRYGGASFVLVYALAVVFLCIPALMAEWALGRQTQRGTLGAFERGRLPGGRGVGRFFFAVVTAATAYYTLAIGWVLYAAVGQVVRALGGEWSEATILPPETGFDAHSMGLQTLTTAVVILACVAVLRRGLRGGIEKASRWIVPALFITLMVLIVRSVTLPGAWAGISWYILKFDLQALTPGAVFAALGQAFFSLSLGGTFMVVYGSYLEPDMPLGRSAVITAMGDLAAGLLAGLAILPAVVALGLEPGTGPGLIFYTLPKMFAAIPFGWFFGLIFFLALFAAAFLSDVAAFEVLVAGLTDNTRLSRRKAIWIMAGFVLLLALPPMINLRIFVPWDLTFGSGMQVLGSLAAVVTFAWCLSPKVAARELGGARWLLYWLRFAVPAALLLVGGWWLMSEVFGV